MKPPMAVPIPEDMTTRDALMRFLKELTRSRGNDPNARILAGLVDAMSRDTELAEAVRAGLLSGRRRVVFDLIERGIARERSGRTRTSRSWPTSSSAPSSCGP